VKTIHSREYRIEDMTKILSEDEPETDHKIWEWHCEIAETRKHGPALSFFHDEELVCCAGVTIYWKGCGEVWLAKAKCWKEYKKEIVIWTGWILDQLQKQNKLVRLQADVVASDETANRYIKHYGFKAEGRMLKYDILGRDCIRYARIRKI
jgi:hypothetical protein